MGVQEALYEEVLIGAVTRWRSKQGMEVRETNALKVYQHVALCDLARVQHCILGPLGPESASTQ